MANGASAATRHGSSPRAGSGPTLPSSGALFGASSNALGGTIEDNERVTTDFEDLVGRKLAVKRVYYSWRDAFPTDLEYWLKDRGTTPILSWTTSINGVPIVTWANVAAGRYDATIDARAADLKAYGAPLFFVFHHEPEGEGDPDDYIAAYRHVHDRFVADGVTNVSYAWVLMDYTFRIGPAAADLWYPGDSYVDVIGSDQYNWYDCPGHEAPWNDFASLAQPFYDYGVGRGKPMMLAEWASREDGANPTRKAAWISGAEATLKTWPEVKVVAYYQNGAGSDVCALDVDTTPQALAAFTAMGADPWFNPPPPLVMVDARPPEVDNHTSATFAFHANVGGSTFTCKLDAASAKSCTSPYTVSGLSQGSHTMKITATDPSSGLSTYDTSIWTVDTVAPIDSLVSTPDGYTPNTQATIQQNTNEPGPSAVFTCQLDADPEETCGVNQTYTDLSDGSHSFTGTTIDAAGNVSASVSYTWTVDTIAPVTTITTGPASSMNSRSATFTFTSNESTVLFKCALDDGTFLTCDSPKTYSSVSDGSHTFQVKATDGASNAGSPASWPWTVDATKPLVAITSGPPANTNSTSAGFSFTVNDANPVTATCQLDALPAAPCGPGVPGGSTSDSFSRSVTDAWGTSDSGQTWKFPADSPQTDFDVAGAGTVALAASNAPRLAYIGQQWQDSEVLFRFSVDKKPTTSRVIAYGLGRYDATTGAFYAVRASLVWDGSMRLDATKKPPSGSEVAMGSELTYPGIAAAATWYWVRARFTNSGPNVLVQGKLWQDGTIEPADWPYSYLDTSAPLTGTGRPALRAQSWSTEVPFVMSFDDLSATAGLTYSGLLDRSHTETITATDAMGNTGTATWTWTVDTVAPTASITSSPASLTNATSATFKFSSSESGSTFTCKLDAGNSNVCTSPKTYSGLSSGSHTFTLTTTDKAGNVSAPVVSTWMVDTTPPIATIDTGPANPTNSKTAVFTFHANEGGSTFKCSLDGASFMSCGTGKTYWSMTDGSHTFKVEAIDPAKNTGTPVSWTWTVDATKPTATITSGPADPSSLSSATFTFTASESGVAFTCQLDSGAATTCTSPAVYNGITAGRHSFKVYGTDLVGNKSSTVTWAWTKL
jgi:hypothetical protein